MIVKTRSMNWEQKVTRNCFERRFPINRKGRVNRKRINRVTLTSLDRESPIQEITIIKRVFDLIAGVGIDAS
jgi:hypothetical protein